MRLNELLLCSITYDSLVIYLVRIRDNVIT